MNRLVLLILAICVGVLTIGVLVYQGMNSSNQSMEPLNVTITSFSLTGYGNQVGVMWSPNFILNYTNYGTVDVSNVTVTITTNSTYEMERWGMVWDNTPPHYQIDRYIIGEPYFLGDIAVGESKQFRGDIDNNLDDWARLDGFAIFATLKSNSTVLSQAIISLE